MPDEYQEVAWLRGNNTQWCILPYGLGFSDGHFYGIIGDIEALDATRYTSFCLASEVGLASQPTYYKRWGVRDYYGTLTAGEVPDATLDYDDSLVWHFEINSDSIIINESVLSNPAYTQYMGSNIKVGARLATDDSRIIENTNVLIKSLKITYDDNVIAEFIPCYRKSDNKAGLFYWIDYSQGTSGFITNSGSGSDWLIGPDV